jgi:hypothetical protein
MENIQETNSGSTAELNMTVWEYCLSQERLEQALRDVSDQEA